MIDLTSLALNLHLPKQMEENPYQSTTSSSSFPESKTIIPHTASVRSEAWRGFKFGAKISAGAMLTIIGMLGVGLVGISVCTTEVNNGSLLEKLSYFGIAILIGQSIFPVLIMSFFGGIAGGLVMSLAAIVRKLRLPRRSAKKP